MIEFKKEGTFLYVSGELDGQGVNELVAAMTTDDIFTLDLDKVTSITFSALRAMLRAYRSSKKFCCINAEDSVAERIEDTGVGFFVCVTRKPKPLQISKFEEFGGSFLSKSFNSKDGDSMLKLYGEKVPKWLVAQEKTIARAVTIFGIPTPLVGTLYEDSEHMAVDFERVVGKHSFSRIISEDESQMEPITVRFAQMCKELHSRECDTKMFHSRKKFYRRAIDQCKELNDEERAKAHAFLDTVPDVTTCLHGDMQMSNVIRSAEGDDLWIDLSDFGYGYPLLDMGMWYFQSVLNIEEIVVDIFHLNKAQMLKIWKIFAREYFDADTPEKIEAAEKLVEPYAALHMLYIGTTYGFLPHMMGYIREKLLK